jgi:hypothetical protein
MGGANRAAGMSVRTSSRLLKGQRLQGKPYSSIFGRGGDIESETSGFEGRELAEGFNTVHLEASKNPPDTPVVNPRDFKKVLCRHVMAQKQLV